MVSCSSIPLSKEAFKAGIVGKSTVTAKTGTDLQGRKGQLEIICQRSFRLHSLPSYLVFCWPLLRAKADSLTSRRGFAATSLFHLALWEHKCMCPPPTLIKLMQLILPVVVSLRFNSKRPQMYDAAEALPQSSMWVSDGHMGKMGVTGHADSTQTTCLQGHAGSSLLSFHISVYARAAPHIWYEIRVMDLCLVQRFILYHFIPKSLCGSSGLERCITVLFIPAIWRGNQS